MDFLPETLPFALMIAKAAFGQPFNVAQFR
jgi:hypothetical protein